MLFLLHKWYRSLQRPSVILLPISTGSWYSFYKHSYSSHHREAEFVTQVMQRKPYPCMTKKYFQSFRSTLFFLIHKKQAAVPSLAKCLIREQMLWVMIPRKEGRIQQKYNKRKMLKTSLVSKAKQISFLHFWHTFPDIYVILNAVFLIIARS